MDLSSDTPLDVLIVGAGLAGVAAARDLRRLAPQLRCKIVEARERLGGTWDLFRYPGVRSDSDIQTLGYADKPIDNGRITAEGGEILAYIEEAARERGLERDILFRHRVVAADFDRAAGLWRVDLEAGADKTPLRLNARFLYWCGGYYDYSAGHMPDFPGAADFSGPILHPQFWPQDFDAAGKRLIVIGSGATAVSLVPALAARARHVVMLQRSPSYVVALPNDDPMARVLAKILPASLAFSLTRWRNILLGQALYQLARRKPDWARRKLLAPIQQRLKLDDEAMKNFTPRYNPWDQRVCLDPDGALFDCLLEGSASLVTGQIEKFTADGLRLRDGETFRADAIIAATGLKIQVFGGARISVDGAPVESGALTAYKGCMFSGLPNFVAGLGYANASWTLKCQLTTLYLLRLMRVLAGKKARWAAPDHPPAAAGPVLALSSGYIQRADSILPRQGAESPWRYNVNYLRDVWALRFGRVDDGALRFG
jgi:monooxygenase